MSGGGRYVTLNAGEGFTYAIVFKCGSLTAKANGAAPRTNATVKIPSGFGTGTATIVLKAEMNPSRASTVTLSLGASDKNGSKPKPKKKK